MGTIGFFLAFIGIFKMSLWFRRFLGLILLIATVGIATCQSLAKASASKFASNTIVFSRV